MNRVDATMWRDRLALPHRPEDMAKRMNGIEKSAFTVLIPGDEHWPKALADLGDRTPYVLWARCATSFLARPMEDFVTITGSRASTSYGQHMAGSLAADIAGTSM
ncbi:DNA-processing protein DprA [Arthrobacter sp. TB 23]|uniref:DNA-processing protein DprA n=1 Tax=Arthrobacter sp. TB 23 TaxID=494419 RepID=UPI00036A657C|nr:DNA-processing protein DprA [Arthrobacter sp. TB 23]